MLLQPCRNVVASLLQRYLQWGPTLVVLGVNNRTMVQQYLHNIGPITTVIRTYCRVQRCFSRIIPDVGIGIVLKQYLNISEVSEIGRKIKWKLVLTPLGIRIRTVIEQPLHDVRNSSSTCFTQWRVIRTVANIDVCTIPVQ
jgi:hypothetical protein